ncbi:MAG: exodeoxyribonuclease III [Candidatus Xenobia bacterium]
MKIATWNVNGIRAREGQLKAWLDAAQPDILCLQEIKATPDQIPPALCQLDGYWCYWHGGKGYSGVALHVNQKKWPTRPEFSHPEFDFENRIVTVRLGALTVGSVYVPNGGKDFPGKMRFLEAIDGYVADVCGNGGSLVLCGDFNVARADRDVHPKLLKAKGEIGYLPQERELIERILGHGLVDVTRTLHPDDENFFTWWAPWRNLRERNIGWRIDYILASADLARQAVAVDSLREVGTSDHAPLVAQFEP